MKREEKHETMGGKSGHGKRGGMGKKETGFGAKLGRKSMSKSADIAGPHK